MPLRFITYHVEPFSGGLRQTDAYTNPQQVVGPVIVPTLGTYIHIALDFQRAARVVHRLLRLQADDGCVAVVAGVIDGEHILLGHAVAVGIAVALSLSASL